MSSRFFVAILFCLPIIDNTAAQCPDSITFTSQGQVDSFRMNYPGCTEMTGPVEITGLVENLDSLIGLTEIGTLNIYNSQLSSLDGLKNVTTVIEDLTIADNNVLADLSSLGSLIAVKGELTISNNVQLKNFSGLDSLTFIGANLNVKKNFMLKSLQGLNNLDTIAGSLIISQNDSLLNLDALENLQHLGDNLKVFYNNSLGDCIAQGICNYLDNPPGTVYITSNKSGCNSKSEVQAGCETLSAAPINVNTAINIFPNPASDFITLQVQSPNLTGSNLVITISDVMNKPVLIKSFHSNGDQLEKTMWLDQKFTAGMYFLKAGCGTQQWIIPLLVTKP